MRFRLFAAALAALLCAAPTITAAADSLPGLKLQAGAYVLQVGKRRFARVHLG